MPIGVTTAKNIKPITKGETIFPKKIPNLNHILFKGESIFEFNKPNIRKIIEITNDQNLISLLFNSG